MRQTETHTLTYWREINALLAAEGEPFATAEEMSAHAFLYRDIMTDEEVVAAIIRERIATAFAALLADDRKAA